MLYFNEHWIGFMNEEDRERLESLPPEEIPGNPYLFYETIDMAMEEFETEREARKCLYEILRNPEYQYLRKLALDSARRIGLIK